MAFDSNGKPMLKRNSSVVIRAIERIEKHKSEIRTFFKLEEKPEQASQKPEKISFKPKYPYVNPEDKKEIPTVQQTYPKPMVGLLKPPRPFAVNLNNTAK